MLEHITTSSNEVLTDGESDNVTAQEGTKVLGKYRRKIRKVWKELCYGKAETLEDAEEAKRWWRYNLV